MEHLRDFNFFKSNYTFFIIIYISIFIFIFIFHMGCHMTSHMFGLMTSFRMLIFSR